MQLHEIISLNENHTETILIEKLLPYKKSLITYYTDLFCAEPYLMVTDCSYGRYGKIVSGNDFNEAIYAYLEVDYIETDETELNFDSDLFAEYETICFNSIALSDL